MQKLNIWRTILGAFLVLTDNLSLFVRTAWFLILILTPLNVLRVTFKPQQLEHNTPEYLEVLSTQTTVGFAELILSYLTIAIFAVMWHRLVLLKEKNQRLFYWNLKTREWHFILSLFLLAIIIAIPLVSLSILIVYLDIFPKDKGPTIAAILVTIIALCLFARILLIFPAIAVENKNVTLFESFEYTRGNVLRLVFILLIASTPVWLISWFFETIRDEYIKINKITIGAISFSLLDTSLNFVGLAIGVGIVSLSYKQLVLGEEI